MSAKLHIEFPGHWQFFETSPDGSVVVTTVRKQTAAEMEAAAEPPPSRPEDRA